MTHRLAHIDFPAAPPGFERGRLSRFDEHGLDLGVEYTGIDDFLGLTATVYVYPAAADLDAAFETSCAEVTSANPGAGAPVRSVENLTGTALRCATFELENTRGVAPRTAVSLVGLLESDGWFVKYRLSDATGRGRADVLRAVRRLAATVPLPATSETVAARHAAAVQTAIQAMFMLGRSEAASAPAEEPARRGAHALVAGHVADAIEACMEQEEADGVEAESGTGLARALADTLRAFCPDRLRVTRGWGATPETAIRLEGARTVDEHLAFVHHLLSFLLGARGTDWTFEAVSLAALRGRYFECVRVKLLPDQDDLTLFVHAFEADPAPAPDAVLGSFVTEGSPRGHLSLTGEAKGSLELTMRHLMMHQGLVLLHDGPGEK